MCRRVTCRSCGRPTYAGCGAHIEQVLADVPREQRCQCRERAAESRAAEAPTGERGGWLRRIFGR